MTGQCAEAKVAPRKKPERDVACGGRSGPVPGALAVGIPAIGYKLDGTPEVVLNSETGYVTAPQDVDAVVKHSRDLLNDAALREKMGANGKALVIERFAWRRMADILEEEFLKLLKEKTGK